MLFVVSVRHETGGEELIGWALGRGWSVWRPFIGGSDFQERGFVSQASGWGGGPLIVVVVVGGVCGNAYSFEIGGRSLFVTP
jgi:hypothetical protein